MKTRYNRPVVDLDPVRSSVRLQSLLVEAGRALSDAWARACDKLIESQLGEDSVATFAKTHTLAETELVGGGRVAWLYPNNEPGWPPRWPRVEMRAGDGFTWAVGIVERDPSAP